MTPPLRVRLRDLSIKDPERRTSILSIVSRFLDHGIFILGHELEAFEKDFAQFVDRRFVIGVSSASAGLYLALRALGIGRGDEVITTPMSVSVTSNAIRLAGAVPVFSDVDQHCNMDPARIEECITSRTRAILPVHFYGRVCDMNEIMAVAGKHGLQVVEDCAQAAGASLGNTPAGAFGTIGVFSFNPMKVIPSMGDAGALAFDDPALVDRVVKLRLCGAGPEDNCETPELKHIMDPLHAAVVRDLLPRASKVIARRHALARRYRERLSGVVTCPDAGEQGRHTFYDYTVLVPKRSDLMAHLRDCGIEVKVRHPILICDQPAYRDLLRRDLPRARALVEQILCLPMHLNLSFDDVEFVCEKVNAFYAT